MIERMQRAGALAILAMTLASCSGYGSAHTRGELCRYPMDFFTNHVHRSGLEVEETIDQDDQIRTAGFCIIDDPSSPFFVYATLTSPEHSRYSRTPEYLEEREAIQVGADTVRVRSGGDKVHLQVDIDEWLGELEVHPDTVGVKPLPDEHLPAAAEMLVKMTRDLKGPSL